MIQLDCPKCLQQINAQDQQAGLRIVCPSCTTSLMVPAPSAGNFDDLFDSDEEILNGPPQGESPPTITDQLLDESIDSQPVNKVQLSPRKQPNKQKPTPKTKPKTSTTAPAEHITEASDFKSPASKSPASKSPASESSGFFEDLQFPETTQQADLGAASEIATEDPFTVDPDKRLEVDGITDVTSIPESYSLKCSVCESHMFVTSDSIGMQIKCADCFSTITVPEPTQKQIEDAANQKTKTPDAAELKTKDAEPNVDVDPSFGLAPVNRDLLAPAQNEDDDLSDDELKLEAPTDLFGDLGDIPKQENASSAFVASKKGKTKSKAKEASQEKIDPYRSRSSQVAKQKKRRKKKTPEPESPAGFGFPKFEFDQLFSEMVNLVTAPTVAARSIIAAVLLAAGNVVGHFAASNYQEIQDPTMGDTAFMWSWRAGVGWTLFGLGTLFLWYTAGVIFRKTAAGERRIDSWRIGPSTEWTSTFLLIGFSFAVAGSPLMMFGATWLSAPLRFFFALPMLVSVWFTQSPFKIISVDAFSRYRRQHPQWKSVWLVVFALASIAFTSGLMMAIPVPFLNIITSLIGAVVLSFTTLGYAAVAGWHSGKVVEDLN